MNSLPIIVLVLQILSSIILALGMFILNQQSKSIDNMKTDLGIAVNDMKKLIGACQLITTCNTFHEGHKDLHRMTDQRNDEKFVGLKNDIDNIGEIARSGK